MKIIEVPHYKNRHEILTLSPETLVSEAVDKMRDRDFGAVLVTEKKKVVGIFTERDLLKRVVAEGRDPKTLMLKNVMTTNVNFAHEDDAVIDSLGRMSNGRFRHLPVLNAKEDLTGFVSQGDFVAMTWPLIFDHMKHRATKQFFSHTQLWMMVILILVWITLVPVIIPS